MNKITLTRFSVQLGKKPDVKNFSIPFCFLWLNSRIYLYNMCLSFAIKILSIEFQFEYLPWITSNSDALFFSSFQFPLYRQQFHSMFLKRALFNWRSWKLTLLHISIILFVTTYLLTTLNLYYIMPAREMDLSLYGRTIVPYSISGNSVLALNIINNLEIFLKLKNQELQEVQGKTCRKKETAAI